MLTFAGAAFAVKGRRIPAACLSSMEAGTWSYAHAVADIIYWRVLFTELGYPPSGPTVVWGDNKPAIDTSTGHATSKASRHFIVRTIFNKWANGIGYDERYVEGRHIAENHNPSDFVSKWVDARKLERSVAFTHNTKNMVTP